MRARRVVVVLGVSMALSGIAPAVASAQPEDPPPPPPVANCDPFSSFVCQVNVPVYIDVDVESIFPPQPSG